MLEGISDRSLNRRDLLRLAMMGLVTYGVLNKSALAQVPLPQEPPTGGPDSYLKVIDWYKDDEGADCVVSDAWTTAQNKSAWERQTSCYNPDGSYKGNVPTPEKYQPPPSHTPEE